MSQRSSDNDPLILSSDREAKQRRGVEFPPPRGAAADFPMSGAVGEAAPPLATPSRTRSSSLAPLKNDAPTGSSKTTAEDGGAVFRKRRREEDCVFPPLARRDDEDEEVSDDEDRPFLSSLKRANPVYDSEEEEDDEDEMIYFGSPAKRHRWSSGRAGNDRCGAAAGPLPLPRRQTFFLPQSMWGTPPARVPLSDTEEENRAYFSLCSPSSCESEDEENE